MQHPLTLRTACLALILAVPVEAQFGLKPAEVTAQACFRLSANEIQVAVRFEIAPGWHLYHHELGGDPAQEVYAKPTTVSASLAGVEWSALRMSEPERYDDRLLGNWAWVHEGEAFAFLAGRPVEAARGIDGIELAIDALVCTSGGDGTCLPYAKRILARACADEDDFASWPSEPSEWPGELPSEPASSAESANPAAAPTSASAPLASRVDVADERWDEVRFPEYQPRREGPQRGLGAWLLLAFVAGLILNVMPCVLPVVSIKVLSFVQQAGESRARVFSLGLAFAAGILLVFLVLAALAVWAGTSWGEQFQSETFLIVMIAIVFAFSLSMFDVFELGVPAPIGALASGPPREGLGDAFFKGIMATVLATPCSGPFLGSTLAWALAQPKATIFLIFVMIGLGMALPYVVLTANPAFLKLVPRPGAWMQTFKQVMGFVLLATVVYLMASVRQDLLLYTAAFLVFVALGCWIWGRWASFDQSRLARLGTLAATLATIGLGASFSFRTLRAFYEGEPGGAGRTSWVDFDPERFARLQAEGHNVFVDFTADWCPNCKYNEKFVFETREVAAAIASSGTICMKADITDDTAYTRMLVRLRNQLGARSIPFLAVFPGDEPERPILKFDVVSRASMLALFDGLPRTPAGAGPVPGPASGGH